MCRIVWRVILSALKGSPSLLPHRSITSHAPATSPADAGQSNATLQPPLEAAATQERRLEAVACKRLLGKVTPGSPVAPNPLTAPSGRHGTLRCAQDVYPLRGF